MKMIEGAAARARRNRSRTRAAATPTYISTNSEPLAEKKGTPASPATALASSVFPVPGGPSSSTPRGSLAPATLNRGLPRIMEMSSWNAWMAGSCPATSANSTPVLPRPSPEVLAARLLPSWEAISWRRLRFLPRSVAYRSSTRVKAANATMGSSQLAACPTSGGYWLAGSTYVRRHATLPDCGGAERRSASFASRSTSSWQSPGSSTVNRCFSIFSAGSSS